MQNWPVLTVLTLALVGCGGSSSSKDDQETNPQVAALSSEIIASDICSNGGVQIDLGLDLNGNGTLDESEITGTEIVCNGTDGEDGTDGINGTDGENPAVGLTLNVANASTEEDASSLTFEVNLSSPQTSELTVTYGTVNVTASSGSDYQASAGTLTFAAGETQQSLSVNILNDDEYECDEYFLLHLNSELANTNAFGLISNDGDTGPSLSFVTTASQVNENAGSTAIELQLDTASCYDATVDITYINSTTSNDDYTGPSSFTIAAGQTTASFEVSIIDDEEKEQRENMLFNLYNRDENEIDVGLISHTLSIMPVSAKLYDGYYSMCAQSQDGLIKCWGYGGGYNLATADDENYGDDFGEASSNPDFACHDSSISALLTTHNYAQGNGVTCTNYGGVGFDAGLDDNGDGELTVDEIDSSTDYCNHSGQSQLLTSASIDAGDYCENGGYIIYHGEDDNNDSIFNLSEMGEYLPVADIGDANVEHLGLGEYHSCALFDDQSVKCWGLNRYGLTGQGINYLINEYIGDETSELGNNLTALDFGNDRYATQLSVGNNHSCVVLDNGQIKCWGQNGSGRLGYGDSDNRGDSAATIGNNLLPVDLGKDEHDIEYTATHISASNAHTCALLNDGQVKCWGNNSDAKLGYGDEEHRGDDANEMGDNLPLVNLGTGRSATAIYAGYQQTCATLDNGALKCWGLNSSGQIGQATSDPTYGNNGIEYSTSQCSSDTQARLIVVEELAIDNGGNCSTYGGKYVRGGYDANDDGSLDLDTEANSSHPICNLSDLNALVEVSTLAIGSEDCADYGGVHYQYGYDHGDDGVFDVEMGDFMPAIDLGNGLSVTDISLNYSNTCVILDDGSLKCWGDGDTIGLDNGNDISDEPGETPALTPSPDLGTDRSAIDIAGRGYQTCALLDNFDVKCWGYSEYGELGNPELYYDFIRDFGDEYVGNGDPKEEMGDNLPAIQLY